MKCKRCPRDARPDRTLCAFCAPGHSRASMKSQRKRREKIEEAHSEMIHARIRLSVQLIEAERVIEELRSEIIALRAMRPI